MNSPATVLLERLDRVHRLGRDRWKACCPAHDDRSPSLAIRDADGRLLVHCFAGCSTDAVLAAAGLTFADLWPDKPLGHHKLRERRPFYAGDVLKIISHEALLVFLYAKTLATGKALTDSDQARLLLAASRLNHANEVANGY